MLCAATMRLAKKTAYKNTSGFNEFIVIKACMWPNFPLALLLQHLLERQLPLVLLLRFARRKA